MLLAVRGGQIRVSNLLPMLGGKRCVFIFATPLHWNCRYGSCSVALGIITLEVLQISKRCASDLAWERSPGVGSAPRARWEAHSCYNVITLEVLQIPIRRCSRLACGAKSLFDFASNVRWEAH